VNSGLHIRNNNKSLLTYLSSFLGVIILLCVLLINPQSVGATSDTCTWSGLGGNTKTTTAGNWTGCDNGNVPEDGDNLVFPNGPTNKTVSIDSAVWFASITFSGNSYIVSPDSTETLGAYGSITLSGNNNTINNQLRLYPTAAATFSHSGTGNNIANNLVIQPLAANADLTFDIDTNVVIPMVAQTAVNGGSSIDTVTKTGVGTLDITGLAVAGLTAGGGIHIQEGAWQCNSTHCVGADANTIFLEDGNDPDGPSLHLNGDDTFPNPITINTGDGEDGSVHIGAEVTLSGAITGTTSLNMFVSGNNTATISSNVSMANGTALVLYGVDGYTTNKLVFNGIISGDVDIIVDDAHVTLAGSNTYTGTTELNDTGSGSVVTVKDNNSLGNSSAGTTVNPGSTLNFDNAGDVGFGEPLTIGGTGVGGSYPGALVKTNQYVALDGGITLTDDAALHNETGELFTIASLINGFYDITLTANNDTGGFGLAPGGENAFGDIIANGIQLIISGAGHTAVPENLTMNAVDGKLSRIWLNSDNMLSDISVVTLNNDDSQNAVLLNTGVSESLGTIVGDGVVYMGDSDASFSLGAGGTSGEFSGTVQGYANSQFQIIDGVWTFSGYNTDLGNGFSSYYINGGKFVANAADTSLSMSPFSISSGILGGTEIIGPVAVYAGTIAPGNSPGCLYPDGDVAFTDENSFLDVEINGTAACSGYDVLNASGTVFLNDAVINLTLLEDYVSTYGNVFTIVQGSSLNGTFSGLSNGDVISVGDKSFRINYTSTSVTLTDITPQAPSVVSLLAGTGYSILLTTLSAASLLMLAFYSGFYRKRKIIDSKQ
jgi:hypothetical protein